MVINPKCANNFIVVLNYNSWEDTLECIEALINSTFKDFQIILIDNNSTNQSQNLILEYLNGKRMPKVNEAFFKEKLISRKTLCLNYFFYNLNLSKISNNCDFILESETLLPNKEDNSPLKYPMIFIQTNKNLGFAGGNNVGLKAIVNNSIINKNTKVMLLNPDTFIDCKSLEFLNKIDKTTFISGCSIKYYNSPRTEGFLGACNIYKPLGTISYLKENDASKIDYIYGGALFTNKQTLIDNGILPDNYFLYWEETDWCYSAKLKGIELTVNENAIVYNKIGTSIGRGYLANYYFIRNGLWFYRKFFRKHIFTLLLSYVIRAIKKIIKFEFSNLRAIINGSRAYFRGEKGNASIN